MKKKKDIWDAIKKSLKTEISEKEMKTWLYPTALITLDRKKAIIEVPNKFVANWLHDHYLSSIQNCFKEELSFEPKIHFTLRNAGFYEDQSEKTAVYTSENRSVHPFNPSFSFENFITCKGNRFAFSSAMETADRPSDLGNPLFIFSKRSLGKTHLLNAIGNHILARNPFSNIRYLSSEDFFKAFSSASTTGTIIEFRKTYHSMDLLLFDDIHRLSAHEKTKEEQEEFVSLFDTFYGERKQIVLTANRPPREIQNMLPKLRSRLEWGLITEIKHLDQRTKMKILKMNLKKLNIPEDINFFLANKTNNMKTLLKYAAYLESHISVYGQPIDLSVVKSLISHRNAQEISVRDIQNVVIEHFNISQQDLVSNKKTKKISYPRQIAMYLCRKLTGLSYKEIGMAFGNKDHSTVIYAVKRIEDEKKAGAEVLNDINKLQSFFSQ